MEFSSYNKYNFINEYVLFLRSNNLIYIETLFLSITITLEQLYNNKFLYGYYLLSLAFTKNPKQILFMEKGVKLGPLHTNIKWCILSNIHWEQQHFIPGVYSGFDTNPYERVLQLSNQDEINTFLKNFKDDMKTCPYIILNSFIKYEISEINYEINYEKKIIDKVKLQITNASLLMSKFLLPIDIALMIVI